MRSPHRSASGRAGLSAAQLEAEGDAANGDKPRPPSKKPKANHWARDVSAYDILEPIGEGTYGKVWKAKEPGCDIVVALKMIKATDKEGNSCDGGFPITSIREIRILRTLTHDNIVELLEVVTDSHGKVEDGKQGDVYMAFEYLEYDLWALANSSQVKLTATHIKTYMKQMLDAIAYMHTNKVMHRDLKLANMLIGADGILKVGDWGLARSFHDNQTKHTPTVITLWYRPPEVLLRTTRYGPAVDMWSVGCILAELLYESPILPGTHEKEQLNLIYSLCGTPTDESWPDRTELPDWSLYAKAAEEHKPRSIQSKFRFDRLGVDLVDKLLTLDPSKRLSAAEALDHPYFWHDPRVVQPSELSKFAIHSCHEFEVKKVKEKERLRRKEAEAKVQEVRAAAANRPSEADAKPSDRW
ncbi:unnamed protein product [Ectocarpus sp. CCAP 1310/34]|nr:unnamed protein product [Ectocarpus sp. CCAP 1310/34]